MTLRSRWILGHFDIVDDSKKVGDRVGHLVYDAKGHHKLIDTLT